MILSLPPRVSIWMAGEEAAPRPRALFSAVGAPEVMVTTVDRRARRAGKLKCMMAKLWVLCVCVCLERVVL